MMPFFRTDGVVLGVLLLCVPLQHLLIKYWGHTEIKRTHALKQFIDNLAKFQSKYLEWDSWKKWCLTLLYVGMENEAWDDSNVYPFDPDNDIGESPAVEVLKYKQKGDYFAQSMEPRIHRSPFVQFRVGQVVIHKVRKYRGVIIGWDETVKAPEAWLESMKGPQSKWKSMPNYAVLVDVRDRLTPQMTYVPEENLEIIENVRIMHPALDSYFERYDGSRYIPRPALKSIYPRD